MIIELIKKDKRIKELESIIRGKDIEIEKLSVVFMKTKANIANLTEKITNLLGVEWSESEEK